LFVLDADENDEQNADEDDPDPNCDNDEDTFSDQEPLYEHGCEEGLDLDDLGCDSWSNSLDHPIKSTSPTNSYKFSEEKALYTQRF